MNTTADYSRNSASASRRAGSRCAGARAESERLFAPAARQRLAIHPGAEAPKRDAIRKMIRDAFYIDADDWRGMVLGQSRTSVLQAVLSLGR